MIDAYAIYCQWQLARGMPAPTREWWDMACAKRQPQPRLDDFEFDIAIEQREGYAYDR